MTKVRVTTGAELLEALAEADEIEVDGSLSGVPMITLRPGVTPRGGTLRFGAKGIRLTGDNTLEDITVLVPDWEVVIGNDTGGADLGRLILRGVRTRGQVPLLAGGAVRAGHVEVDGLTVASADLRGRAERPHGFGVDAMPGAFTLWNRQTDPAVRITASLKGLSVGTAESPIRGSGVFVAGHVDADLLRTGPVFTDGGIEPGTPDLISGGVFVVSGARVAAVINDGPVTTSGANDMVLDNWGEVGSWTARAPVTSHGPSGIGFVNFGALDRLDVQAPVTTHGAGARGFNVYDGSLASARFHSITTHADGAVGIQVSRELPLLDITEGVTTFGGRGSSLVRGQQVALRATAVSILPGGRIGRLSVGSLTTHGDDVVTLDVGGDLATLTVEQQIAATGAGSDAIRHVGDIAGLDEVMVTATHGQRVVRRATEERRSPEHQG